MNTAKLITACIILGTILLWIVWDVIAFVRYGIRATESFTITDWCRRFPWIVFILGYLAGHWIGFSL